jgi:hypothetical protein
LFSVPSLFPFLPGQPLVMACHITGVYDVNRNNILPDDDFAPVQAWATSLKAQQVNGIIFHNNFSEASCAAQQHKQLHFIRIDYDAVFNPNIYRYIVYREFLRLHATKITSLFVTDIADVVMIQDPFTQPLFMANIGKLFCGDEPVPLQNEWMINHATHLRNNIADYKAYEKAFENFPLLNCGIIGGSSLLMQNFIEQLAALHEQYNRNNTTAYTGDMGAFNYLARTRFNSHLLYGQPVNTIFKAYQNERTDCWFRHK